MRHVRFLSLLAVLALAVCVAGCGVSKDKYEALLNEKVLLEEKVSVLTKAKEALKNEYDALLNDKMDVSSKLETALNEKTALKSEYDKILDEKVAIKAEYDKLLAQFKELEAKVGSAVGEPVKKILE